MKFNELYTEEKVRLDPKCWTGKKIGNPKTKVKGGVRVNNCVPAESVEEDLSRRGFLKGAGAAAVGAGAGIAGDRFLNPQPKTPQEIITNAIKSGKWSLKAYRDARNEGYSDEEIADFLTDYKDQIYTKYKRDEPPPPKGVVPGVDLPRESVNQGVAEEYNPEYDDEAGMADNNLETLRRTVEGIDDLIQSGDNLPEWCQEKIAVAKSMLVSVWDYMYSEEASDEVDPEIDAMFEAMDQLAEELATKHQVDVDTVWESFEQLDDHMLYETAAWRRKEGKSKSGGLNAKGVASYRRENPGSKLQTAVTTKPSKLKPGSKAAKRRKSFCARMSGVKGPMKKPNGKPTRKALALRKWNC